MATTEHAGERGVQLSVGGAEMEAYGDQAAAATTNFTVSLREEPTLARSCKGHLILTPTFQDSNKHQCSLISVGIFNIFVFELVIQNVCPQFTHAKHMCKAG